MVSSPQNILAVWRWMRTIIASSKAKSCNLISISAHAVVPAVLQKLCSELMAYDAC